MIEAVDPSCFGLFPARPDDQRCLGLIVDAEGVRWSRDTLRRQSLEIAACFAAPGKFLVLIVASNGAGLVTALLGAWMAGHAVLLADTSMPQARLAAWAVLYRPEFVAAAPAIARDLLPDGADVGTAAGLAIRAAAAPSGAVIAPELALLLSTSGTTGSPRTVRLSRGNLVANARQIAAALAMAPGDICAAHLPLTYSYGLSVLTSHLLCGGGIGVISASITSADFWTGLARSGATQLPGVPFHHQFLARADLEACLPPGLRSVTQAGGALDPRIQSRLHTGLNTLGKRLYVMYGQTEAAPRMTVLDPDRLPDKLGSVGTALPGGRISIVNADGGDTGSPVGEIVYRGPNVMLGHAEGRSDLALGDVAGGVLRTGDLGRLDDEGFLYLTGRAARFAKLHGLRLGLDEIEAALAAAGEVAALDGGGLVRLFTPVPGPVASAARALAQRYQLPSSSFAIVEVASLPRLPSGKIDYRGLETLI